MSVNVWDVPRARDVQVPVVVLVQVNVMQHAVLVVLVAQEDAILNVVAVQAVQVHAQEVVVKDVVNHVEDALDVAMVVVPLARECVTIHAVRLVVQLALELALDL